ncbi:MAG TPA: hypothetical protein DEQ04_01985, partial [Thermovirga lienii]|nr:hypothetical protein [Thermovirga lienii]
IGKFIHGFAFQKLQDRVGRVFQAFISSLKPFAVRNPSRCHPKGFPFEGDFLPQGFDASQVFLWFNKLLRKTPIT